MPYSLLFVTACNALLPHAVQFLFVAVCSVRSLLFVAARCTICYLLLLAIQLSYSLIFIAARRTACYLLLHAAQLGILYSRAFCRIFYSLLFVAASHTVSHLLLCAM